MTGQLSSLPALPFGRTRDGRPATLYTLENARLRVRIMDYGGRVASIEAPDRHGRRDHVLLGFDDVETYEAAGAAFGALLGRNANRLAGGRFSVDGRTYELPTNDRGSTLHGGPTGFDMVLWKVAAATGGATPTLALDHVSPDGDQGFPGELSVRATYRLEDDALRLTFEAHTTQPTVVSLSAHPYFNLAGAGRSDVLDHVVTIAADEFLPTDEKQIPTGEIRAVAGTPFDFRAPAPLGARIRVADTQLLHGLGYDHCFVLGTGPAGAPRLAARVVDPASGRTLEIHTTQRGMQLYSGNQLDGSLAGRGGVIYRQSAALALEPQGFPDAPNHPAFPTTILRPGARYEEVILYRFAAAG